MEFNYKAQKSEVSKIKVLEVSSSDILFGLPVVWKTLLFWT